MELEIYELKKITDSLNNCMAIHFYHLVQVPYTRIFIGISICSMEWHPVFFLFGEYFAPTKSLHV